MTVLHTTFVERVTLRSGLAELQPVSRQLGFALQLFDAFTRKNQLVGGYDADAMEQADQDYADRTGDRRRLAGYTTVRLSGRSLVPFRKRSAGAYLFFVELAPGSYVVNVRSPYYQPLDVTVTLPMTSLVWPAFPDVTLANEDIPLESPSQPAAYRLQRTAATLVPSAGYPFPQDATLVRGTIRSGGVPLAGATVARPGDPRAYVTGPAGDYVLFLTDIPGVGGPVTIQAAHPLHATVTVAVQALRGMTVLQDITLV
jgi:hypothetical protein